MKKNLDVIKPGSVKVLEIMSREREGGISQSES